MAFAYRIAIVSSGVPMRHATSARDLEIGGTESAGARTCQEASGTCGNHPNSPTLARSRSRDGASTGQNVAFTDPLTDSLEAFGSEAELQGLTLVPDSAAQAVSGVPERAVPLDWSAVIAALKWVGVILFSATTAAAAVWEYQRRTTLPATGSVTIQTTPPGREVLIDGRSLGLTPVDECRSRPRRMPFQVGSGAERRDLTVDVSAGSSVLQHLELPAAPATPVATDGRSPCPDRAFGTDHHGRWRRARAVSTYRQ